MQIRLLLVVGMMLTVRAHIAQARGSVIDCGVSQRSGAQTCVATPGLGKVKEAVAIYEQRNGASDIWVGKAAIVEASNGATKIEVIESFRPIHRGLKVVNENEMDFGTTNAFSNSDSSFADDRPTEAVDF